MPNFGELLGTEFWEKRTKLGFTQLHVARRAFGTDDARQVGRYERFEMASPRPKAFMPICEVLGILPERVFELAKAADNKRTINLSTLEADGSISPKLLAEAIRADENAENSANDLHFLIIINGSTDAMKELEALMSDTSIHLRSLDYCFRFYHYAFRHEFSIKLHKRALSYLDALLRHENFDVSDKSAFSIGELYLYSPFEEIRLCAKDVLYQREAHSDRVAELVKYTRRRVGLLG